MRIQRLAALRKLYFDLPMAPRPCPNCGGLTGKVLLHWDRYLLRIDIKQCGQCGFVHSSRNLNQDSVREFYTNVYPWLMYRLPREALNYDHSKKVQAGFRWQRILERIGLPGSVFELGAGDGHFLAEAQRLGITQIAAVEPAPDSRQRMAKKLGLKKCQLSADLSDSGDTAANSELIAMFHVLEHLDDPVVTLRQLTDGFDGWLVIEVPDLLGDWSKIGLINFHISHRSYFTARTLRILLGKVGFSVIHEERENLETGIYPGNLRVFARREPNVAGLLTAEHEAVAEQIARYVKPWSWHHGYPRALIRMIRLALS